MSRPRKPEKEKHIVRALQGARYRAKRDNVAYNLNKEYLLSIAPDECPIFHTPFIWGSSGMGVGKTKHEAPTLDRIIPELGYIEGNVAFISHRANRLKDNGTMQEHYAIADWIWNQTHAKKKSTSPVPTGHHQQGEIYPELGPFSATGTGQDDNDSHHHCGADARKDADHRAQESSGDSVGRGGEKVGTSCLPPGLEDYGISGTAACWTWR